MVRHSDDMSHDGSTRRPSTHSEVKVVTMTEEHLEALLKRAVQAGVRDFMTAFLPSLMGRPGAGPPSTPGEEILSPTQVRNMARCGASQVSEALKSGDLRGRKEKGRNTSTRHAGDGTKKIPSYVWIIARDDALDWIRRRNINKYRRT